MKEKTRMEKREAAKQCMELAIAWIDSGFALPEEQELEAFAESAGIALYYDDDRIGIDDEVVYFDRSR